LPTPSRRRVSNQAFLFAGAGDRCSPAAADLALHLRLRGQAKPYAAVSWLFAFLYLLFGLVVAQQIVIRASGMKYMDFLKNVRSAAFGERK
jgi:hypothetical protein